MKNLEVIATILLLIGGLNWGLVGLFDFNLVTFLFGQFPAIVRAIYAVVGLAALYQVFQWKAVQERWK
ncbi:Uncharacterized protein PHSC3_001816 [Chlamydiales bacterium STE3]|nr:Uncharacterized protein PHSC3_001816 [Chlamydiales bacterium STE3]